MKRRAQQLSYSIFTVRSDYVKIVNLAETQSVTIGDSVVLSCSALIGSTLFDVVTWARNGWRYKPIQEDPFCFTASSISYLILIVLTVRDLPSIYYASHNSAHVIVPQILKNWGGIELERIYSLHSKIAVHCWAVGSINNVTWNDAGEYSCEASSLSKINSMIKQQITLEIGKMFIDALRVQLLCADLTSFQFHVKTRWLRSRQPSQWQAKVSYYIMSYRRSSILSISANNYTY